MMWKERKDHHSKLLERMTREQLVAVAEIMALGEREVWKEHGGPVSKECLIYAIQKRDPYYGNDI